MASKMPYVAPELTIVAPSELTAIAVVIICALHKVSHRKYIVLLNEPCKVDGTHESDLARDIGPSWKAHDEISVYLTKYFPNL